MKVAPDGTVYVPNRSCGSKAAAVVSNDNGITWTVRPNPSSSTTGFLVDPSVGIGTNNVGKPTGQASNTIYLGYQAADGHPRIAVSHDQGATWINDQDVGTTFGIVNSTFPEVVAGDDNRAAYAFLGATVVGDYTNQATYDQSAPWHLYIATTFDGGATWTTADATPNDPVQRGSICNLGTTSCNGHNPNDRNLLDFMDATIDAQGRTLVAYPDGCVGSCVNKPSGTHPNSYTSRASIARQSGGRRLFAAFDPTEPNLPAAPRAKAEISTAGGPTIVSWPATDDSGSPITSYKVYRRDGAGGSFNLVATVSGISFSDTTFTAPATSNAYRVTAVNAFGEGPYAGDVVPVVVTFESSCAYPYITVGGEGIPGTVPTDPTSGELTIQRLNVGEPFSTCDDNSLTFIMKVNTLDPQGAGTAVLPPNSEWQILFGVTDTDGNAQKAYVAVDTFSPNTPATPRISIGRRDPTATGTLDSRVCTNDLTNTCPAISATFNKDGTIVFKLSLATPISFGAPGTGATGTVFTWDGRAAGTTIGAAQVITGTTYVLAGAGAGLLETVQTNSGEEYTRVGNTVCATGVPNASLTANPTSGAVPLTVNFDASASSVPQSCNTIASYALDFGDGSTGNQSSPTFSHAYNNAGDYTARLTVTDSAGRTSTNASQVLIHVTTAAPTPTPTPALLPAPPDPGPKVGFQNFEAPPTLVSVTSSSQGPSAKTVEYLGHDAGEPSIGNNWKTGTTVYQSDLQTLFITFNDSCPSGSPATWVNRPAPTSQFVDSDPIGFTDRYTGRTFAGELTLTSPSCKTSFTDDDGQTWIATQGSGLGASVDHESIGGGPFHAPLTRPA
ncbi:MAG TPA: PKD domain-containing protein, partial [Bryobacteraceae bacterium]|nr:PKD domain-containing protein [Bryobacteraceae bacterium]